MRSWTLDEAARLGATLRRIDSSLLKAPAGSVWFQGGEPYLDVFIELVGEEIAWLQVTVRGRSLTWRKSSGVKTGRTNELVVDTGYASSKTLAEDQTLDAETLAFVRAMLGVLVSDPLIRRALDLLG